MSRIPIADFAVGWIVHVAACIARFHGVDSLDLIKDSFKTPETPPGQCRSMKIGVHMNTPFLPLIDAALCKVSLRLIDNDIPKNLLKKDNKNRGGGSEPCPYGTTCLHYR